MPSAVIVHAAVFTAGAVIGGGLAVAVSNKNRATQPPPIIPYTPAPRPNESTPVIGLDIISGKTQLSKGLTITSNLPAVLKYGNPGPISDTLVRKAYVAGYDRRLRHPAWTAEHLTRANLAKLGGEPVGDRANSKFIEDDDVPDTFRARLQDYFRSGYDRGHMVPAADAKISQEAMNETFLLSNIAPQVGEGFNRHYWAYLEDWCRRLTGTFQDVYVFTVPLYLPKQEADGKWRVTHEVIGSPPNVSVPTHFAKVVLTTRPTSPSAPDVHEISTGAFVLPNAIIRDDAPLEGFTVPVEAVERAAGLSLFSDQIKAQSKHICRSTKCEVIVRKFDDAQKKGRKAVASPKYT
ncbi:mitochondrial nuclease [Pholiota conissans]|uniref:Endonuclease n=1 Tax=Pholiota conissans TaxID=109636 RepID=A0A9P5YV38_9AGAR|nr:mitochondrial nuclease [Pholiota conissans]